MTGDPTGRVFDALADPNRRYVVEALAQRPTATATELAAEPLGQRVCVRFRIPDDDQIDVESWLVQQEVADGTPDEVRRAGEGLQDRPELLEPLQAHLEQRHS